jgi:uncharacterized membrane protein YedE/YeeE
LSSLYRAIFVDVWPWWVGGPAIGLFTLAFQYFPKRLLSGSGTYHGVIEATQGKGDPETDPFGRRTGLGDLPVSHDDKAPRWRVWFFGGLALGGLLSGALAGGYAQDLSLPGMGAFFGLGAAGQIAVLALGGVLIGFGTRFCGGCTSGHAIVGISGRQWPSVAATAIFFATGMAATFLIHWLGGRP